MAGKVFVDAWTLGDWPVAGRVGRLRHDSRSPGSAVKRYAVVESGMQRIISRRVRPTMHTYGDDFYAFLSSFALRSAAKVVPVVGAATGARSVVDFGCGLGAWLSVWKASGAAVHGVDGPYVNQDRLLIDKAEFEPLDLVAPIDLGRRFDLVQSLETAEHLAAARAAGFVANLVAHADKVLFSAAVPGQGGEHHVNEQPLEYWRGLFRAHGYAAVDIVRPSLRDDPEVQAWYRCNSILYVKHEAVAALSDTARAAVVADGVPLADYWPLRDRVRQAVVRRLPTDVVDWLSRLNARRYAWQR
jgi:SAM-dependent methyltransferase